MAVRKIKIENKDGIGYNTRVIDAETGEYIRSVQKVELTFDVNHPVRAILHCVDVEADLDNITVDEIVTTHVAPGKEPRVTRTKVKA